MQVYKGSLIMILILILVFSLTNFSLAEDLLHPIKEENISKINDILENGVDINATYDNCVTPLIYAARHNCLEVAQLLIKNGAIVNSTNCAYYICRNI